MKQKLLDLAYKISEEECHCNIKQIGKKSWKIRYCKSCGFLLKISNVCKEIIRQRHKLKENETKSTKML